MAQREKTTAAAETAAITCKNATINLRKPVLVNNQQSMQTEIAEQFKLNKEIRTKLAANRNKSNIFADCIDIDNQSTSKTHKLFRKNQNAPVAKTESETVLGEKHKFQIQNLAATTIRSSKPFVIQSAYAFNIEPRTEGKTIEKKPESKNVKTIEFFHQEPRNLQVIQAEAISDQQCNQQIQDMIKSISNIS